MDIKVDNNTVIVFDLDDTLYNELDYLKSAYLQIAKLLEPNNYNDLYAKMFLLYREKKNVFEQLSSNYDIEISRLLGLYRNHIPEIQLFEGARKLLESIKYKNGLLGIITDGRSKTQMTKIKALKISDLIDYIVISENIGTEKPNEKNFLSIVSKLKGNSYYYIADNLKKDFITPKKMGWRTIGLIDNGKNIHYNSSLVQNSEYKPDQFIISFDEISII